MTSHDAASGTHRRGRSSEPSVDKTYDPADGARDRIAADICTAKRDADARAANAGQRTAVTHEYEVGDILYATWGFEDTKVDFYEVVALNGRQTITIRKLKTDAPEGHELENGFMTGLRVPKPHDYAGDPMRKRVPPDDNNQSVRIPSYSYASRWDGKPKRVSWYG